MKMKISSNRGLSLLTSMLFLLFMALGSIGCDSLLEVENPNNVLEEDLNSPSAANAITSGALATTTRAIGYVLAPYTTATDEGGWIGSRDAWNQLDRGTIGDHNNEFVDAAWPFITEARYTSEKAIERLKEFDAASTLKDRKNLAKAYLYAALVRVTIGDMFDNFVYSDKREPGPSIGETNMGKVYDEAIAYLDAGLVIAQTSTAGTAADLSELQRRILALRARAKHGKAVWQKTNPRPVAQPLANPYVNAGADDAAAALAVGPMAANYRWQLSYAAATTLNEWSFEVNSRRELSVAAPAKDLVETAKDDPRIVAETADFKNNTKYGGDRYSPYTVVSEREMQLIIAEGHVANGNNQAAADVMNALRTRDALAPLTDVAQAGALLQHERRANLFMMGRRLLDMYRFNIKAAQWQPSADAVTNPGTLFPITIQERRANPLVAGGG